MLFPKRPASHAPLHNDEFAPDVAPYRPSPHAVHDPCPASLYWPAGHTTAVEVVDPDAHAYLALHAPLHADVVKPVVFPNLPAAHAMHDPEPVVLYCPVAHIAAVELVDPAGQAYPAVQGPVQAAVNKLLLNPYLPASHGPLHVDTVRPLVLPKYPTAHALHVDDPTPLHCPAGHTFAVAFFDPDGQ